MTDEVPELGGGNRDVTWRESPGPHNSLWYWVKIVGFWKTVKNYLLMSLARISPSLRLKHWLYRGMGVTVGSHVSVGLEATFDIFYPEHITLGDDTIVGYSTTILCHEFTREGYGVGPVVVGEDVTIGANCTILPGVTIGEGATVSAHSLVNKDIPPGETWGGVPARRIK